MSFWSWQSLRAQADTLTLLLLAVVVTALSLLDWIDPEDVSTWTLAVLALLCFTIVKDRHTRSTDADQAKQIQTTLVSLDNRLSVDDEMGAVAPEGIASWFAAAWLRTAWWRFKGGTGTYLRAQTLPGLARTQTTVEVWAEILPPDDIEVCNRYGAQRRKARLRQTPLGGAASWGNDDVRIESYATIVAAIWYTEHTSVRVHVALMPTMSTIRLDMCDDSVLVTNEYPDSRGLAIKDTDGGFFASSKRELEVSFEQARQLDLRGGSLPRQEISGDDVRAALKTVGGLEDDDAFLTGARCAEIALKAISKDHAASLGVAQGGAVDPYPPRL